MAVHPTTVDAVLVAEPVAVMAMVGDWDTGAADGTTATSVASPVATDVVTAVLATPDSVLLVPAVDLVSTVHHALTHIHTPDLDQDLAAAIAIADTVAVATDVHADIDDHAAHAALLCLLFFHLPAAVQFQTAAEPHAVAWDTAVLRWCNLAR
jgi:hypothetical protein